MMESAVDKDATAGFGALARRIGMIVLGGFGALLGVGVITGFIAAHQEHGGGPMSVRDVLILAGAGLFVLGCLYAGWRAVRSLRTTSVASGPPTPREGRYRMVMILAGVLGGAIGLILALQDDTLTGTPLSLLNGPLSPGIAIALALLVGVLLPALSIYWHLRAIDEQEAAAYNKGALFAMYAYWVGAPVWWLLWRGGLVAAPDGVLIYLATAVIATVTWFWVKYR
jgi:hypothetical protein